MVKTMKIAFTLVTILFVASIHAQHQISATEQIVQMSENGDIHAYHALDEMRWAAAGVNALQAPASSSLPADDMGAADRLAKSPRQGEFVKIDVGGTPMRAWVVRPVQPKAPVVVVIQEIFGLSDWIRSVADQLAADGFIAVAPDLLAGKGPNGGDSSSFADPADVTKATLSLSPADVIAKLKAAREYGLKLPISNGRSGSVGFCFGGNQSFLLAVEEPALNAAVVYYGTPPAGAAPGGGAQAFNPSARVASVKAPVLGLYGGLKEDARIGNTIAATEAKMKELGKTYEPHIFDGAGHGFLRAQMGNNGANMKATQQAWPLTVAWLRKYAS
jgi:carboxymethylenebutenolidase